MHRIIANECFSFNEKLIRDRIMENIFYDPNESQLYMNF